MDKKWKFAIEYKFVMISDLDLFNDIMAKNSNVGEWNLVKKYKTQGSAIRAYATRKFNKVNNIGWMANHSHIYPERTHYSGYKLRIVHYY